MKKCFQAKGVCTITAHTPLSATLVWQLSHYLFRETCFMNSYPTAAFLFVFQTFTQFNSICVVSFQVYLKTGNLSSGAIAAAGLVYRLSDML